MEQIICKNLTLGYDGKEVVRDINVTISKGDYLCVIGENGSGKTTFMKAILGLHPQIRGEIEFCNGVTLRDIGYLPQQTDAQKDFPASVTEIVLSGCRRRLFFYSKADKSRAQNVMERLGILPIANKCYRDLSGGQKQRVLLARALCATGKILVLDEPTAALDSGMTDTTYSIIDELNRRGVTIIMVTHDATGVLKYAKSILDIGGSVTYKKNTEGAAE